MLYLQTFLDSLMIGGVYSVIAVGLSLIFGVMRVINWSHGESLMVSMLLALYLNQYTSLNPYVIMIITGIVMFGYGYLLQNVVISRILAREKAREPISCLLFTAGLGMALSNGALLIFGPKQVMAQTQYTGKSLHLGELIVSVPKLIAFILAVIFVAALWIFLQKTEYGRAIRATSQNRSVATLMGISEKRVYSLSFAIGTMLVGLAGGMLIPYFPVYPTVGSVFSNKSFVIVVLGGKGSVPGALLGGLIIGLIEKFGTLFFSDSVSQIIVFLMFIAILLFKPTGLLSKDKG